MDKPKKDKPMNGLIFSVMTFVFKIRDALNPPKDKLMETERLVNCILTELFSHLEDLAK